LLRLRTAAAAGRHQRGTHEDGQHRRRASHSDHLHASRNAATSRRICGRVPTVIRT